MANELSRHASRGYLSSVTLALSAGISSWVDFAEQMRFVVASSDAVDPVAQYARRVLAASDEDIQNDWQLGECDGGISGKDARLAAETPPANSEHRSFFMTSVPQMEEWIFHPFDSDFRPSVPHGHWRGAPNPKLDVYLGWVYRNSQQIRREPRRNIIALWNDKDFRGFARKSIEYYLKHYPHYSGWPVANPRKLPRPRR
jgi:hypothetical protein